MRWFRNSSTLAGGLVSASAAHAVSAPVQLQLTHQLDEERVERLEPLIEQFNSQQKDVQVSLVRRVEGDAPKALNLVTREEYSRFAAKKVQFRPLSKVMREAKQTLDAAKLSPERRPA